MKILAFVDVHGDIKAVDNLVRIANEEKPDFLICAGDISDWGKNLKVLLKKFKGLQLMIIPGNHEDEDALREICKEFGFIYLHTGCYELNKYKFFGYGSGGFCIEDRNFENLIKKFKRVIEKGDKVILVTHGPPYGNKLDRINGGHAGCKSYNKFIKEVGVNLCICGHFHETSGNFDTLGRTVLINPGKGGKIIEI
jgi:Icc-related predicted phosphoesterase